jgi:predicted GH43/DUF377 family glycosyl hydrolase
MRIWAVADTAFSDSGPLTSLAYTKEFRNFERVGATLPPEKEGGWWDANKIGLSLQPIQTPNGWLVMYQVCAKRYPN